VSQRGESAGSEAPREPRGGAGERLGIAGSGTIACGIAACAAVHGLEALVWARSPKSADRARAAVERVCGQLERPETAAAVRVTEELPELGLSTLVIEAVSEQERVKRKVIGALGDALDDDALIATTTSSLRVSELALASGFPERFFGLHVFNPVTRMKLVELCFPDEAGDLTRERAAAFCEAIGKRAVEVPDEPGFVVNRLLFPFLFDAVRLLERTGLSPDEIDACMKLGASHPMGPLELLDLVGLDVAEAIGEALHADTGDPGHRPPGRIKQLVGVGRLGRKSGAGFFEYRRPPG
jgi:3-hydroxybutyryl-CoA dehydrogenase